MCLPAYVILYCNRLVAETAFLLLFEEGSISALDLDLILCKSGPDGLDGCWQSLMGLGLHAICYCKHLSV